MTHFVKFWTPLILWMLFIFVASTDLMSSEHTSRLLIPFLLWLKPDMSFATIDSIDFLVRKIAHLMEYAIFAGLLWRAIHHGTSLRARFRVEATIVFFFATLYAASDEFHQSFVYSRGPSPRDVMIDGGGVLLGLAASWLVARKRPSESTFVAIE